MRRLFPKNADEPGSGVIVVIAAPFFVAAVTLLGSGDRINVIPQVTPFYAILPTEPRIEKDPPATGGRNKTRPDTAWNAKRLVRRCFAKPCVLPGPS